MRPLHAVNAMFIVIMELRTMSSCVKHLRSMSSCVKLQHQAPPQDRRKTACNFQLSATSIIYAAGALCTAASQVYTAVAVQ